jgi:hypothetical protein
MSAVASASGDEACRKLLAVHSAIYGELEPDAFYQEMIAARRLIEGDAVAGTGAAISRMPTRAPEAEGHNTMARSELIQDLYRTYGWFTHLVARSDSDLAKGPVDRQKQPDVKLSAIPADG